MEHGCRRILSANVRFCENTRALHDCNGRRSQEARAEKRAASVRASLGKSHIMPDVALRIVVVGGVAGGASAATRARRMNERAEIVLLEKDEHVSFANCGLPYHIGHEIADRGKLLVATKELLERRFRLDVRTRQEVTAIHRDGKTVTVRDHTNGQEYELRYDKLILSPGAAPFVPPIPGRTAAGVFTLRNIADMDGIMASVDASKSKKAIVVGAGFIGLEVVEQLVHRNFTVSLAELQPQVLPPFDPEMVQPIRASLRSHGVQLITGDGIQAVTTDGEDVATGIELASGHRLDGDVVILGLGVRPNTRLAEDAGLALGETGGIRSNRTLQTNDPDIYAVGDASEYVYGPTGQSMRVPLAGPANRAGRLAGEHAATGSCAPMADVFGTAIVRVFDQTAAMTGLSLKAATRLGIHASSVTVVAGQHAGYFPGAKPAHAQTRVRAWRRAGAGRPSRWARRHRQTHRRRGHGHELPRDGPRPGGAGPVLCPALWVGQGSDPSGGPSPRATTWITSTRSCPPMRTSSGFR